MKKILLLLMLSISFTSFSQTNIQGIGIFKINITTISIIDSLTKNGYIINELIADTNDVLKSNYHASFCNSSKVFKIEEYIVSSISLKNIYVTFSNDTLIKFHCDENSELLSALSLKYGTPMDESDTKTISCEYVNLGTKLNREEITIRSFWRNTSIKATYTKLLFYNSSCEKLFTAFFEITDTLKSTLDYKCSQKVKTEILVKANKIKALKYKDF